MENLQLNINKLSLKKEDKKNKSYYLSESNIQMIEKLATENNSKASVVLDDILNYVLKLEKERL